MKKILLFIFLIISFSYPQTYLVEEYFQGSGVPFNWAISTGAGDWDYNVNAIHGTESLMLDNDATNQVTNNAFSQIEIIWVFFMFQVDTALPVLNSYFMNFQQGGTNKFQIRYYDDGDIRIYHGAINVTTTATNIITAGSTKNIWIKYIAETTPGVSSDGIADVYVQTDDGSGMATIPETPTLTVTGGDGDGITRLLPRNLTASAGKHIFDYILVSIDSIGNVNLNEKDWYVEQRFSGFPKFSN